MIAIAKFVFGFAFLIILTIVGTLNYYDYYGIVLDLVPFLVAVSILILILEVGAYSRPLNIVIAILLIVHMTTISFFFISNLNENYLGKYYSWYAILIFLCIVPFFIKVYMRIKI